MLVYKKVVCSALHVHKRIRMAPLPRIPSCVSHVLTITFFHSISEFIKIVMVLGAKQVRNLRNLMCHKQKVRYKSLKFDIL